MEALTRLVVDSLARHGLDRPVDPRRLQWSRWFRCDSAHSLLVVPSKPGIFAIAEEIGVARAPASSTANEIVRSALQRCESEPGRDAALAAEVPVRRMLAVLQFSEDDDMAFTLDRMFTRSNPLRSRLSSGCCFIRFVALENPVQRRSICTVLNQWIQSSAEKAGGLPADFSSSVEMTEARVARTPHSATAGTATPIQSARETNSIHLAPHLDSGANKNLHCPHPLPSGF